MAFLLSSSLTLTLAFISSLLLSLSQGQEYSRAQTRAPHGLAFENQIAFPPSALEFFNPPYSPQSSFPQVSSQAKANQVFTWPAPPSHGLRGGGAVVVVLAVVFAVVAAAGNVYVVMKRRANAARAKAAIQPDV